MSNVPEKQSRSIDFQGVNPICWYKIKEYNLAEHRIFHRIYPTQYSRPKYNFLHVFGFYKYKSTIQMVFSESIFRRVCNFSCFLYFTFL